MFSMQRVVLASLVLASTYVGEASPNTTWPTEAVTPTHRPPDEAGRLARLSIGAMAAKQGLGAVWSKKSILSI